jgi:hypothetical protein
MSVKIRLEKDGYQKNAFVGFSWTIFFFGFWVPLFRGRFKDFLYFFMFFICKIFIIILFIKEIFDIAYTIDEYNSLEISYYIIIPIILLVSLYPIDIFLAYTYNKYSTTKMFEEGFYLSDDDAYTAAVLKDYTYLPYTEEEFADEELLKRYEQHSKKARKSEKNKAVIAIVLFCAYQVLMSFISVMSRISEIQKM